MLFQSLESVALFVMKIVIAKNWRWHYMKIVVRVEFARVVQVAGLGCDTALVFAHHLLSVSLAVVGVRLEAGEAFGPRWGEAINPELGGQRS
jgi:hypothetical protein